MKTNSLMERMSGKRRDVTVLSLFLLLLWANVVMAVPACPGGAKVKQPDGTEITIHLRGDEYAHWNESEDGFLITKSKKSGEWVYMTEEAGEAVASRYVVGKAVPKAIGALRPDKKKLSAQAKQSRTEKLMVEEEPALLQKTGTMLNLVVLVNFSDLTVEYSPEDYNDLFNQIGYTVDGAAGSVKDYYQEVSYNAFTVQSTVVEAVTLDNGYAYYGANDAYGNDIRPREMVQEALAKLEARGFDFSTMDGDGDWWVDGLTIIHAGGGEEYGGNDSNYIWSHQWSLSDSVMYDGVRMLMYHTEPARRGWDDYPSSQGITRIGVICHENGHFIGLPDLYDYGYDSEGAGDFCLMAGGMWNGDSGTRPSHTSAWCRSELGWVSPTLIESSGEYSLGQVETNAQVYKLQGLFPSTEYFLVENRQGVGFDSGLPGWARGVLIWHVDETRPNNDDQTHYKVDLEEASGTQHLELNMNPGEDSDYFRAGNATMFTESSTPNNLGYAGQILGVNITDVGTSGDSMPITIETAPFVNILGSWTAGTTNPKVPGNNRALVFVAHSEDNDDPSIVLDSVSYGGQAMTKIVERVVGSTTNSRAYVTAFVLDEAGIAAASGDTFTVVWNQTPDYVGYSSVFLQNVKQTTLIGATASNGVTNTNTIATSALPTGNGDMVLYAATSTSFGFYTPNNGFVESLEVDMIPNADGCGGYKSATGADETPSVSHSISSNVRHVLIGFVAQLAEVPYQTCSDVQAGGDGLESDLTGDCYVNYWDLKIMADYWLDTNCAEPSNCEGADFEPVNGIVDLYDLSDFAGQWLQCNNPADANCIPNW